MPDSVERAEARSSAGQYFRMRAQGPVKYRGSMAPAPALRANMPPCSALPKLLHWTSNARMMPGVPLEGFEYAHRPEPIRLKPACAHQGAKVAKSTR